MPIFYRNQHIGTRCVDFLIEEVISLEIKAVIRLEDVHLAQAINYPWKHITLKLVCLLILAAKALNLKE